MLLAATAPAVKPSFGPPSHSPCVPDPGHCCSHHGAPAPGRQRRHGAELQAAAALPVKPSSGSSPPSWFVPQARPP
uniref:Uncharacterized protein n=1 Tax=Arundo donax TaxID=35708 RepID=A0A0A9HY48_ARUDO